MTLHPQSSFQGSSRGEKSPSSGSPHRQVIYVVWLFSLWSPSRSSPEFSAQTAPNYFQGHPLGRPCYLYAKLQERGSKQSLEMHVGVSMLVSDRLLAMQNKTRSKREMEQIRGWRGNTLYSAKLPNRNLKSLKF